MWKSRNEGIRCQRQIMDYLSLKDIFHYRNNSGALGAEHKGKKWFVRFGALGSPDIICVMPYYDGGPCHWPVSWDRGKTVKGKQSVHQTEWSLLRVRFIVETVEGTEGSAGMCDELVCVPELSPDGFHDQTNQRIRSSIRKKNQIKTKRIRPENRNWLS